MSTYWKPRVATLAGFVLGVIGFLGFFRIDAQTLWAAMTKHLWFLTIAVGGVALFLVGIYWWWKSTRVTPENVQGKIREWLDNFGIPNTIANWERWHFGYNVMIRNQVVWVGRPESLGGRYLRIELRTTGLSDEVMPAFAALTHFEKRQLYAHVAVETARAKINLSSNNPKDHNDLSDIRIGKQLAITSKLSESEFIDALDEVQQGGMLVCNAIGLLLEKKPEPAPPALG